jgi:zinc transporter
LALLRTAVSDRKGLVWAYQLASGESLPADEPLESSPAGPVWLHFNLSDTRARQWLVDRAGLSSAASNALLDAQGRVRLHVMPEGVVAILADLHHDFRGDPEGFGELRLFVDRERVISARRHPLKTVDVLKRTLECGERFASTDDWLGRLSQLLAASFAELVDELIDRVDEIEDEVVAGTGQAQRAALANIRRLLVRLRRHLHADRAALARLPMAGSDAERAGLRRGLERLEGVAQDLDLVHERVRLLQEELAGLLAEATNRNLFVLSTVTTVLLPTTMITGLWGMNVGGVPWADDPHGFAWTVLVVLGSVALCLVLLRGSRVV